MLPSPLTEGSLAWLLRGSRSGLPPTRIVAAEISRIVLVVRSSSKTWARPLSAPTGTIVVAVEVKATKRPSAEIEGSSDGDADEPPAGTQIEARLVIPGVSGPPGP